MRKKISYKFRIFPDAIGEWRWRIEASNGDIVADNGEGYKKRAQAVRMVERLLKFFKENDVEIIKSWENGK